MHIRDNKRNHYGIINAQFVEIQIENLKKNSLGKRIRSVPGNNVLPVSNSAIIHPTDQISTV